jgi:hypothetical protein
MATGGKRGGRREGAGRKAGGRNRLTVTAAALREKFLTEAESPLEVMIDNMRTARAAGARLLDKLGQVDLTAGADAATIDAWANLQKEVRALMLLSHECAKDAAPYVHPKLANIEVDGNLTLTWEDALAALD